MKSEEELFNEFFDELKKIPITEHSIEEITVLDCCCSQRENQVVSCEGDIVCSKCGTVLCDFLPVNPTDYEMIRDYTFRNRYRPYDPLKYQRKKIRYLAKEQFCDRMKSNCPELSNCKNIEQVKKVLRIYGKSKEYKNAYLYLPKLPVWLLELFYCFIYHIKRYYGDHKKNKKKFFISSFLYRESLKLFQHWIPPLSNYFQSVLDIYFPKMKHTKTENANIYVLITTLSGMNFELLDKDMKRLLITDPEFIKQMAYQNSFGMNPESAELELSRYQMINAFEGYKLNEVDRINKLSNPALPLRLLAPEEHAENMADISNHPMERSNQDNGRLGLTDGPVKEETIQNGANTVPIRNIEVIDSNHVMPKNSIQSIQSKVERFKELHSREIESQKIIKKAKDLLNKHVSRNPNIGNTSKDLTGSTASTDLFSTNPKQ